MWCPWTVDAATEVLKGNSVWDVLCQKYTHRVLRTLVSAVKLLQVGKVMVYTVAVKHRELVMRTSDFLQL